MRYFWIFVAVFALRALLALVPRPKDACRCRSCRRGYFAWGAAYALIRRRGH